MKRLLGMMGLLLVISGCASTPEGRAQFWQRFREYQAYSQQQAAERRAEQNQERYLQALENMGNRGSQFNPVHVQIDPY